MSRKVNDGDLTGYKQDKFKNSRFDQDQRGNQYENYISGVSRRSINTLGRMLNDDWRNNPDKGNRGRGPRGYKRSDESIYEDVCVMLSRSPAIDASEIEVSVKDGIVYLNGSVSDREIKKRAELEVENISGVVDVQNLLNFNSAKKDFH